MGDEYEGDPAWAYLATTIASIDMLGIWIIYYEF
jgi:hypothetical protein